VYLIVLVVMYVVVPGSWILLDYLMPPPGCSIVKLISGDACSLLLSTASALHALAAALIGLLAAVLLVDALRRRRDR
jgi:hypothetical protein